MPAESETKVPRCDWRTFLDATDETPADVIAALDGHFDCYCQPEITERDGKKDVRVECPNCRKGLGMSGFLAGGGFTWGLAHGEGLCSSCGWPASGHHFVRDAEGETLLTIHHFPLPYHPDFVRKTMDDPA